MHLHCLERENSYVSMYILRSIYDTVNSSKLKNFYFFSSFISFCSLKNFVLFPFDLVSAGVTAG